MVIQISTLKTKALTVKKKVNFGELPSFKTHCSFTFSTSVSVSDWARTLSHTCADPRLGWLVGVKDLRLSWNSWQHFHHPTCPPCPMQSLLCAPPELHGACKTRHMAQRRAGGTSALAGGSLGLVP